MSNLEKNKNPSADEIIGFKATQAEKSQEEDRSFNKDESTFNKGDKDFDQKQQKMDKLGKDFESGNQKGVNQWEQDLHKISNEGQ